MNWQKHVYFDKALQWLEGDERMLERVRVIFMKNIPAQVEMLGAALEQGDAGSAERIAHTIKGSAAMMGAVLMSRQAGLIEQSVIERDLHKARLQFSAIAAEYELVMAALRAHGERA